MNPKSESHALQRDLFAQAAARCRQKNRARRQGLTALASLLLLGSLALFNLRPASLPPVADPTPASPESDLPPAVITPPAFETLSTDEELLAALADQGPMLITHPDGRKELILTRPH